MADEIHISSLIVHARPADCPAVRRAITAMNGAEVHAATAAGKLVVTLETGNESDIAARLTDINALPGVVSAVLVFHQFEPATATANDTERRTWTSPAVS